MKENVSIRFFMVRIILACFTALLNSTSTAQDTVYARSIVDTLSSEKFWGRGYTNNGLETAKKFLEKEFKDAGLQPMDGKSFLQPLEYPVNTFPGKTEVKINGKELRPGHDFIIEPESKGLKGNFTLQKSDSNIFVNKPALLIVTVLEKLTWSVAREVAGYTSLTILKGAITGEPASIEINIENKFIEKFRTANVCGIVKGTDQPDSMVLFSAHYDHLGGMGRETFFPGANDNGSGISVLLGLAKWYAKNPQRYSMGFICFTGEEAGLIGSKHFVDNPLFPLRSIRFLVNLDLNGTGIEGATVVNATEFEDEFALLTSINEKNKYLVQINSRGKAANSDHHWFTVRDVPSFFIYTLGGIKAYHDVYDISATLPMNEYADLYRLLQDFSAELTDGK